MSRKTFVRILPLLLVGFWWTASPVAQAAVWNIEIVQDTNNPILSFTSLAYDSVGNPSIAYGADGVRFAVRTGGTWSTELVDPATMTRIELAYDPNGNPSIAFAAHAGPGFDIMFACRSGASWNVERVARKVSGSAVALAYGADGNPSIAYSKNNRLTLATRIGTSWDTETVESQIDVGSEVSLALDSGDGRLSIAYTDDQRSGTGQYVKLQVFRRFEQSWDLQH